MIVAQAPKSQHKHCFLWSTKQKSSTHQKSAECSLDGYTRCETQAQNTSCVCPTPQESEEGNASEVKVAKSQGRATERQRAGTPPGRPETTQTPPRAGNAISLFSKRKGVPLGVRAVGWFWWLLYFGMYEDWLTNVSCPRDARCSWKVLSCAAGRQEFIQIIAVLRGHTVEPVCSSFGRCADSAALLS